MNPLPLFVEASNGAYVIQHSTFVLIGQTIFFMVVAFLLLWTPIKNKHTFMAEPVKNILLLCGALLFLYFGLKGTYLLIARPPALILTKEGITQPTLFSSKDPFMAWQDIESISIKHTHRRHHDSEELILRATSPYIDAMEIDLEYFPCSAMELQKILMDSMKEFQPAMYETLATQETEKMLAALSPEEKQRLLVQLKKSANVQ